MFDPSDDRPRHVGGVLEFAGVHRIQRVVPLELQAARIEIEGPAPLGACVVEIEQAEVHDRQIVVPRKVGRIARDQRLVGVHRLLVVVNHVEEIRASGSILLALRHLID